MGFPLRGRGRAFAVAKVPAGRCPCGSAGRIATGNPPPQQPAVVVASNPATLMYNKKPHTLAGTGLICCSRVDDGIPPLGPRQSLCCRKGARREVSLRLSRMNCHRQFIPTTPASGCRGFESRHANAQQKAPYLSRYGAFCCSRVVKGGRTRRDSAIIFCGIKNRNIDISMFLFC